MTSRIARRSRSAIARPTSAATSLDLVEDLGELGPGQLDVGRRQPDRRPPWSLRTARGGPVGGRGLARGGGVPCGAGGGAGGSSPPAPPMSAGRGRAQRRVRRGGVARLGRAGWSRRRAWRRRSGTRRSESGARDPDRTDRAWAAVVQGSGSGQVPRDPPMIPAALRQRREGPAIELLGGVEEPVRPADGGIDRADRAAAGDPPQLALELLDPLRRARPARAGSRCRRRSGDPLGKRTSAAGSRGRNAKTSRAWARATSENASAGVSRLPSSAWRTRSRSCLDLGGLGLGRRSRVAPTRALGEPEHEEAQLVELGHLGAQPAAERRPRSPRRGAGWPRPGTPPRQPAARRHRGPESRTSRVLRDQLAQTIELREPAPVGTWP